MLPPPMAFPRLSGEARIKGRVGYKLSQATGIDAEKVDYCRIPLICDIEYVHVQSHDFFLNKHHIIKGH